METNTEEKKAKSQSFQITTEEEKLKAVESIQIADLELKEKESATKNLEDELEQINKRAIEIKQLITDKKKSFAEDKKKLNQMITNLKDALANYEIDKVLGKTAA
ncbi:hypothetical protein [Leptospira weilii]|uniref:hypothetical protein n=1 Tax=Leptospira weilii TaxID=28184 RepID=UPI0002E1ECF7|nr:hypothetical protein [Leptospira weilii]